MIRGNVERNMLTLDKVLFVSFLLQDTFDIPLHGINLEVSLFDGFGTFSYVLLESLNGGVEFVVVGLDLVQMLLLCLEGVCEFFIGLLDENLIFGRNFDTASFMTFGV